MRDWFGCDRTVTGLLGASTNAPSSSNWLARRRAKSSEAQGDVSDSSLERIWSHTSLATARSSRTWSNEYVLVVDAVGDGVAVSDALGSSCMFACLRTRSATV